MPKTSRDNQISTDKILIDRMCVLCEPDISDIYKTVFEPGCGNGAFLAAILLLRLKKIKNSSEILVAVETLYGIDIIMANVLATRARLLQILADFLANFPHDQKNLLEKTKKILETNIIQVNFLSQDFDNYSERWLS